MAVTSLWHIKGKLKDLINYVENPEKTISKDKDLQDFYNVFSYRQLPNLPKIFQNEEKARQTER